MNAYWPVCPCGRPNAAWRYYLASGDSGWRCACGDHRPDEIDTKDAVTVELPDPSTEAGAA